MCDWAAKIGFAGPVHAPGCGVVLCFFRSDYLNYLWLLASSAASPLAPIIDESRMGESSKPRPAAAAAEGVLSCAGESAANEAPRDCRPEDSEVECNDDGVWSLLVCCCCGGVCLENDSLNHEGVDRWLGGEARALLSLLEARLWLRL